MRSELLTRCDELLESAPPRALSSQKRSIVFDTNILLDRWVFHDPAVNFIDEMMSNGSWQSIGHRETLIELIDVISRSQFSLNSEEQDFILKRWMNEVRNYRLSATAGTKMTTNFLLSLCKLLPVCCSAKIKKSSKRGQRQENSGSPF